MNWFDFGGGMIVGAMLMIVIAIFIAHQLDKADQT
jgi:hypothetical protein